MVDEVFVEVIDGRDRDLNHDLLALRDVIQTLQKGSLQKLFSFLLVVDGDGDLGLEDRNHALGQDLLTNLKLLVNNSMDALSVSSVNNRTLLGAEDALLDATVEKLIELRHGLHDLNVVLFVGQTLVDLEKRNDTLLLPEVLGGRNAFNLAVHRHFEQDGCEYLLGGEGWRGNQTATHSVDKIKHLSIRGICVILDAVSAKRLRGGSAGLVKGSDEALGLSHASGLLLVHYSSFYVAIMGNVDVV